MPRTTKDNNKVTRGSSNSGRSGSRTRTSTRGGASVPKSSSRSASTSSRSTSGTSRTRTIGSNNSNNSNNDGSNNGGSNGSSKYYTGETIKVSGMLEIFPDYGVIRQEEALNDDLPKDVYISQSQIKRFSLRMGDVVEGYARAPKEGERYLSLLQVETVDNMTPDEARKRPFFNKLTPIFPNEWMKLETKPDILSTRMIDLIAPIGKGQRAMLVAPPKSGKTWLMQEVANGITANHPEVIIFVALIGERPEEVTHMDRNVKGEVFASNFDDHPETQTRVAEICVEKAKRLAEKGEDVVILMDSLTRLGRAYNMVVPPSGRTLTGGFDPSALYPAKRFFGAARNFEEGGSLTIIATALVDTGSRMDDVIFEEFKGTGNMELRLDRSLYNRRIFPTIDIKNSGTRNEDSLYDAQTLESVHKLRRMIDLLEDSETTPLVIQQLKKTKSNEEFLKTLHKG